mmetsp:Transcript_10975/g.14721  ORF Transcript_10975/g.14721 Transcript_10975/m.14721 type:complete len:359 (+) Transcript_10975:253-1329(+)
MCKPSGSDNQNSHLRQRNGASVSNGNKSVEPEVNASLGASQKDSTSPFFNILFLLLISYGSLEFAQWFPYQLFPEAALATYVPASYQYDEIETRFDNTIWTWGTDYGLFIIFSYAAYRCFTAVASPKGRSPSARLRTLSAALLALYAISVFAGGWAHQFFLTLDSLNTVEFRIIWTICVGTVTAAGGVMGAIGSEISRSFNVRSSHLVKEEIFSTPAFPDWFWAGWAIYMTSACAIGSISFKRPACDIFIAGTTQFVPSVHCVSSLFVRYWADQKAHKGQNNSGEVRRLYRIFHYVGFFFNAPLLPSYPLLVQYTSLSLGTVNSLLHFWLLMGWGMQALSLYHLSTGLSSSSTTSSTL